MSPSTPCYISASRRTDLPRFRANQFFDAWRTGEITYDGGYGRTYTVSLRIEDVLGYVFWSKDYSVFLRHSDFRQLLERNNAVFHFTLNNSPALEPRLPPVPRRLDTLRELSEMVGPERVLWRFDPVCRFEANDGTIMSTEGAYFNLLPQVAGAGIKHCYFSFMTMYGKTARRPVRFLAFESDERKRIAASMLEAASGVGMKLYNCCNEDIPELVPGIEMAHCIDDTILRETDRFGVHRALNPAPTREGCGCYESRDIGSYNPACPHGCFYCYANPRIDDAGCTHPGPHTNNQSCVSGA